MTDAIARLIVRTSAWLVPAYVRARWREEWLGEIEGSHGGALRHALGAPRDALLSRWTMRTPGEWARAGWNVDIRDAVRALRRTPIQTATIIVCLTIGSTLTVLMFGVVNTMLGGDVPGVSDRATLVTLGIVDGERRRGLLMGEFRQLPDDIPGFASVGGQLNWRFSTNVNGLARYAEGGFVTGRYFSTLGTTPALGRLVQPDDDRAGAPPVAVVSHGLWQRRFGADPNILGATVQIGIGTYRVIGVLPRGFVGLDAGHPGETSEGQDEVWLAMSQMWIYPGYAAARVDRAVGPRLIGRLAPGVTRGQAEGGAQPVLSSIARSSSTPQARITSAFTPFVLGPDADEAPTVVAVLMLVPFAILGIACANVAGVQLARAVGRTHEIAVRVSLGASRIRVVRGLVVETGLVAMVSGVIAWFVSTQALRLAGDVLPFPVAADSRVLAFSALLPMLITLVAGLAPAWRATGFDVLSGLRLGRSVGRPASRRLRQVIVTAQVSLSVLLLMAAAYLVRSLQSLPDAIGPLRDDIVTASVSFSDLGLNESRRRLIRATLEEQVMSLPGVTATAVSSGGLRGEGGGSSCWARDAASVSGFESNPMSATTEGYFSALGLPLRQGRIFSRHELSGIVVNEAFVATLENSAGALGATIRVRRSPGELGVPATIIGVVADAYERAPRGAPRPLCYVSLDGAWANNFMLVARTSNPRMLIPEITRRLQTMDARLAPRPIGTVGDLLRQQYRALLGIATGLGSAAVMALLLAAVGLFGVMAHGASMRSHEFGIRLALGARRLDITSNVVRESLGITMVGAAIGFIASIPLAIMFGSAFLRSITWRDPIPVLLVVGVLAAVGVLATLLPALRISQIDPVNALRQE